MGLDKYKNGWICMQSCLIKEIGGDFKWVIIFQYS